MASCYLLSKASLPIFLPYLYPSDRAGAEAGEIRVLGSVITQPPKGEVAVGALAFTLDGETARVRSISVSPDYQNCGLAQELLRELRYLLPALGGFEIRLSLIEYSESFAPLDHILRSQGFTTEGASIYSTHKLSDFVNSPALKQRKLPAHYAALTLAELPVSKRSLFSRQAVEHGVIDRSPNWAQADPQLTRFSLDSRGEIRACVCISRTDTGIHVDWIYQRTPQDALLLMDLLAGALDSALALCGPEADCTAVLLDESSQRLMELVGGNSARQHRSIRYALDLLDQPDLKALAEKTVEEA